MQNWKEIIFGAMSLFILFSMENIKELDALDETKLAHLRGALILSEAIVDKEDKNG